MNCTKPVVDSPPSLVLLSTFMLSPLLAWTSTMATEGISPTLPLAIQSHTYSKAVHMTGLKYSSDHLFKSQERYTKAFSRNPLPLNRTTKPFRIWPVLTPCPISSSCLPPSTLSTQIMDLLVAFHTPCFLPLFYSNTLHLECPSLTWLGLTEILFIL